MSYEFIIVEKKENCTILTLNRPEVSNAIHPMISQEISQAIDEFDEDPKQRALILTGAGDKAFSVGNDLKFTAKHGMEKTQAMMESVKGGFGGITQRSDSTKPIIAAINGHALEEGFEMALACDFLIATDNATFSLPQSPSGMMARANKEKRPRKTPYDLAMEMILTSSRVPAQLAQEYGFINKVVPLNQLMKKAEECAAEVSKGAPLSLQASKEEGMNSSMSEAARSFFPATQMMQESEAFTWKPSPLWKGR